MHAPPQVFGSPVQLAELQPGRTLLDRVRMFAPTLPHLTGVTPAVALLDTDLLLRDLKYAVANETLTALMIGTRTGLLRLYAALSVWHEVIRHIDDRAASLQWDPVRAREVWVIGYAPWINFIDASTIRLTNPLVAEGARRDPKDVQTAQLVIALTPDVFLSCNRKHFPGLQPVGRQWLAVNLAYRDKFVRDIGSMEATMMWSLVASMGFNATQALVRRVTSLDRRVLVGLAVLAGTALFYGPTRNAILDAAHDTWSGVTDALRTNVPPILDQAGQRDVTAYYAQEVLTTVRRTDVKPSIVRDYAATALARADTRLSVHQLQREMAAWGYRSASPNAASYLRRVLREQPRLFREDNHGRWGLAVLRALPRPAPAANQA